MILFKAPQKVCFDANSMNLFLAGTIDQGNSEDWQTKVINHFKDSPLTILNPRRDDWDVSWDQSIYNPQFREQVEWELDCLDKCSHILMHFEESSKSPITLLELGLYANSKKIIVSCPMKFWRRGNIEIISNKFKIPLFTNLVDALAYFDLAN